jgi:hypothetical protein
MRVPADSWLLVTDIDQPRTLCGILGVDDGSGFVRGFCEH